MKKRKAFLYYRVSTTSEEQETSFIAQSNYSSDEFDIIQRFGDKGSARSVNKRVNFKEMLYKCNINILEVEGQTIFTTGDRVPEVNLILVSHTSRFMRNQLLMSSLLSTLKKNNVEVIFLDLNKSSFDDSINFILQILFLLDEQESENMSFKINRGLEKARKQKNVILAGRNNFGLDYIKKENKLIKNKDAGIVKEIFESYKNGSSITDLAIKYNFTDSKIHRILLNERYCGMISYDKYIYDKNHERKRTRNKDVTYIKNDRIEPIISFELFEECQKIKEDRKNGNRKKGQITYPLTSKIKCCNCGNNFFRHYERGNYVAWRCLNKKYKVCDMPTVSESMIIKYLKSDYGISALKNGFEYRITDAIKNLKNSKDTTSYEDYINVLSSRLERLKTLYIMGDIQESEYLNQRDNIKEELEKHQEYIEQIKEKEETLKDLEYLKDNYLSIFDYLEKLLEDKDKNLIFEEIESIEVEKMLDVLTLGTDKEKNTPFIKKIVFKKLLPVEKYMLFLPKEN